MKQEKEKYVINLIKVSKNLYTWKNKNSKKLAKLFTEMGARCPHMLSYGKQTYLGWYDWFPFNDTVWWLVTMYNRLTALIKETPDAPDYYLHYRTELYKANKQHFKGRKYLSSGYYATTNEEFEAHNKYCKEQDYGNE